jgi:hypothetical protein
LITPTVVIGLMNSWTRREKILLGLVGDDAEARLLHGQPGERLGVWRHGRGHGVDDRIHLCLRKLGEDELRVLRAPRERACLGN